MQIRYLGSLAHAYIPDEWLTSMVARVSARKIYYLQDGRNAWHSTWVERRYNNSFRLTLNETKSFAEQNRTCGSVFHIVEVPCLTFETKYGYFLTTQLQIEVPYKNFRPPNNRHDLVSKIHKLRAPLMNDARLNNYIKCQIERYSPDGNLKSSRTLEKHLTIFKGKEFWTPRNKSTPIMLLVSPMDAGGIEEIKKEARMKTWRSSSLGSSYYLQWHQTESFYKSFGTVRASSHYA